MIDFSSICGLTNREAGFHISKEGKPASVAQGGLAKAQSNVGL
jgi:hypothetical protein